MARLLALSLFSVPQPAPRLQISQVTRFLSWDQNRVECERRSNEFPGWRIDRRSTAVGQPTLET